ncbi:MAG: ribonuclease HII [Candidatus Bathyarchaeota archaeon]|nr:ribonuclease HII [Candidatus Bathyarchaeota archaeon]
MLVAGVDDAGRGCVIGPLVIAGILMQEEDLHKLVKLGVKDSKLLSPYRREQLELEIKQIAQKHTIVKLPPAEIDEVVLKGRKLHRLNWLEAKAMAKVIERLRPEKAYVDASDILEKRFGEDVKRNISFDVEIVSEHKADQKYPIVSAASVIAKVERDREIELLRQRHGDFGSGYPSDPKTIVFLQQILQKYGEYPDFVRKSWKPAKKALIENEKAQTKLM